MIWAWPEGLPIVSVAAIIAIGANTAGRCLAHFMCNVLAHAGKQGRRVVAAFIGIAFAQDDEGWHQVADQLRSKVPKLPTS